MEFLCLTLFRDVLPLRGGELVLAHADPLLHAGGDGRARVGVEGGEPTQPAEENQSVRGGRTRTPHAHTHVRTDTHKMYMTHGQRPHVTHKPIHSHTHTHTTTHNYTHTHSYTHRMYMMTPRDHMSHDLSYFSGPSTSGADGQTDTPSP